MALGLASTFACAAACAKREEPVVSHFRPHDAAVPSASPVDHLAPGELVEGTEKVFGLVLPRVMHVERRFDDVAFVSGPVEPAAAAKYIEARVREGTAKETAEGHTFDKVRVPGEAKVLRIIVARAPTGSGTRIQLRDETPPSTINTPPDEESRWRAVGLKPNGEPLDRTKLK